MIQKLFVLLLTSTSLALHGYLISIRFHQVGLGPWAIVRITSETAAALYLFILSLWSICTSSVAHHSALTANICAIAGISFLHWYLVTLGQALAINYFSNPHWSEYTLFALAGFISISSALIPMGPKLHQDLSKLYSKAVTRKVEEAGYDAETAHTPNVNEEVSSTIFGRLMFTFVYPMISKTSIMDQVDIQDVPAAHAYFRTQNILKESVHVNDASGIKTSFGPTIALLYTVWSPEWKAVTKGKNNIAYYTHLQDLRTCFCFVHCGISLTSVYNRFSISLTMSLATEQQLPLQYFLSLSGSSTLSFYFNNSTYHPFMSIPD